MRIIDEGWLKARQERHNAREEQLRIQVAQGTHGRADMRVRRSEHNSPDVWRRGHKYKKKEKVWYMDTGFLNWIEDVGSIAVAGSELLFDERQGNHTGMEIPYRQLGMLPGHQYRVMVKYSPVGAREQYIDPENGETYWLRLQIACGKRFYEDFDYNDLYVDVYSSGKTPPGEYEAVTAVVDFTGLEKIPGTMRIQTLPCYGEDGCPPFAIGSLTVTDAGTGETVYSNDFDFGMYAAKKDTDEVPDEQAETWQVIDEPVPVIEEPQTKTLPKDEPVPAAE